MTLSNTYIIWYWWQRSECVCKRAEIILLGENRCTWKTSCTNDNFSTINPSWTGLGSNLGLQAERSKSSHLSHRVVLYSCTYSYKVYTYTPYGTLCVLVALVCCYEWACSNTRYHNVVLAAPMARSSFRLNV